MKFKIWSIFSTLLYFGAAILFITFVAANQDWALYAGLICMVLAVITGIPLRKQLKSRLPAAARTKTESIRNLADALFSVAASRCQAASACLRCCAASASCMPPLFV